MSEHANTRKDLYVHSCSSVWVIFSILAHYAFIAQYIFFFSFLMRSVKEYIDACLSKQIQESMFVSIAAHL